MADWQFWAVACGIAVAVLVVLIQALRHASAIDGSAQQMDQRVYRDQLSEIDRDLARGTLPPDEADRQRTEVSRRLLAADKLAQQPGGGPSATVPPVQVALVLATVLAGAVWVYLRLGSPGYPDLPLADRLELADAAYQNRPEQATLEAAQPAPPLPDTLDPSVLPLMEKLRAAVAARPDDMQGVELLARNEAALGNFAAAHVAQAKLIALKGAAATADDQAMLAELRILAVGGLVTAEAEAALTAALQIDPANGTALYYLGLMFAQVGRLDRAFVVWRDLLEASPPDAPWVAAIRGEIEGLAEAAGVRYTPPAAMPGPDAGAVAAAADMTDADRQAVIGSMVAQLSDRLTTQGGSADEWARLITSLGVLGETDRAIATYADAQTRFVGKPDELAMLEQAARSAGIVP